MAVFSVLWQKKSGQVATVSNTSLTWQVNLPGKAVLKVAKKLYLQLCIFILLYIYIFIFIYCIYVFSSIYFVAQIFYINVEFDF